MADRTPHLTQAQVAALFQGPPERVTVPDRGREVSILEATFAVQLRASHMPACEREYRFHPPRQWRFDFAWPGRKLALEIEGGLHGYGRHQRPAGFAKDCEKYFQAAMDGWVVMRVTSSMVRDGRALEWVKLGLLAASFWPRVQLPKDRAECWLWTGATTPNGYGALRGFDGGTMYVHRVSLLLHDVELDPHLTVDHLCRNRLCVNPAHLEQVTRGENASRGTKRDVCKRGGHPLKRTPAGRSWCPECQRERRASEDGRADG